MIRSLFYLFIADAKVLLECTMRVMHRLRTFGEIAWAIATEDVLDFDCVGMWRGIFSHSKQDAPFFHCEDFLSCFGSRFDPTISMWLWAKLQGCNDACSKIQACL